LNTPENTDGIQEQQLPQSQVWPRRQEVQQQVLVRPAPIEGVERMNTVIINLQQQWQDPYQDITHM